MRLLPLMLSAITVVIGTVLIWPQGANGQTRPNIVLILADDLDRAIPAFRPPIMPNLATGIVQAGASFSNAFVNVPLCAPSRATLLTGRYAHNTRILRNGPNSGSFTAFHSNGGEASTIATWLRQAGYETALFGKYLNRYPDTVAQTFVPPGWSDWAVPVQGSLSGQYLLNENGTLITRDGAADDYFTDVLAAKSLSFIGRAVTAGKPFFLMVAPTAPHAPATPAPRHSTLFGDRTAPRQESFNEADITDKPPFLRLPPISASRLGAINAVYRNRLRSLQAVDEALLAIFQRVKALGQLGRTYFVLTADNGYHLGQHRMTDSTGGGKETMYDEDLRVPLFVRGPNIPAGLDVTHLVTLADLAPTFAAWAGVRPGRTVDGRSLVPLLSDTPPETWRQSIPIAHWAPVGQPATNASQDFVGVRTAHHAYVRYPRFGLRDLYDVRADPNQLHNLAAVANSSVGDALDTLTTALSTCSGETCRSLENSAVP